jgi:hypothetical protein
MKCFTNTECLEWLESHRIEGVSAEGWPEVVGDYEVLFAAPRDARAQGLLARDLVAWVGEFEAALFWLSDWPFYKADEMAIISGLRRAHGEHRKLLDAPGHLFASGEREELTGWVSLMMSFGWDGHLFPFPFRGSMFQTSHEDFVWVVASDTNQFGQARKVVRKYELKIHRETEGA